MNLRPTPSDGIKARWAQIKRLNENQLKNLHNLEKNRFKQNLEAGHGYAYASALAAGISLLEDYNAQLGPFWAKGVPDSDQQAQNEAFYRHIFKFWKPIWDSLEKGDTKYEIQAIHAVDLAVWHDSEYLYPRASGLSGFRKAEFKDVKAAQAGDA